MLQMSKQYEPEFKKKIVRLHLEEGRTLKGLAAEYGVSKASISIWVKQFREESNFATWLYRIAYNTTISELRKRKHEFTAIDDNFSNIPDDEISETLDEITTEDKLQLLDTVLKKLPPDDALLISMFYINDQSVKNISIITGNSEANVKVKLYRIRKIINFEINKLIQS